MYLNPLINGKSYKDRKLDLIYFLMERYNTLSTLFLLRNQHLTGFICNNQFKGNTEDRKNVKRQHWFIFSKISNVWNNPIFQQTNFKGHNLKGEWKTHSLNKYYLTETCIIKNIVNIFSNHPSIPLYRYFHRFDLLCELWLQKSQCWVIFLLEKNLKKYTYIFNIYLPFYQWFSSENY